MGLCCLGKKFTQNMEGDVVLLLYQPELLQSLSGFLLERIRVSSRLSGSEGHL